MSNVEEIKAAIGRLTLQERLELNAWLRGVAEEEHDAWDQQMDEDHQAGRLETLFAPTAEELIPFPGNQLP